jgi:uncharacterized membrane protein YidH (DUF202 family)
MTGKRTIVDLERTGNVTMDALAVMLVAVGLWIGASALLIYHRTRWPVARGTVSSCRSSYSTEWDTFMQQYECVYSYEIGGATYESREKGLTALHRSRLLHSIREGSEVRVRYHPSRPHRSVLEPLPRKTVMVLICLGVVLVFGGILVLLVRHG